MTRGGAQRVDNAVPVADSDVRVRIPRESCHPIHVKVATDSKAKLPPIPFEGCH